MTAAAIETRPEPARRLFKVDPFILISEADANEYPLDVVKKAVAMIERRIDW